MRLRFYILLILLLTLRNGHAHAAAVGVSAETNGLWLGRHLEILKDTDPGLTLSDLQSGAHEKEFFSVPQNVPSLGYFNGNSYWARFTLHNPTQKPVELLLASRYATIDFLTFYWPDSTGIYQSLTLGDCVAFSKRLVKNRYPVFPITVPPGQHTYYVHLETTTAVQFSLALWTPMKFLDYEVKEANYLGLLFGVCFVMFFYNLFVSIKFNSRAYAAYVAYIFLYSLFTSLYHGVLQQYVFPEMENGWDLQNFIFMTIDIISISCATFSIEFLELKKSAPRLYRFLWIFRAVLALNLLNWLTLGLAAKHITLTGNFFFSLALMLIGLYRSFSYRPARYYTLGWSIFLTSNLIMLLGHNGIINDTSIGPWAQFTGAVIELVLLSLALGERMALINSERQSGLVQQQMLQAQLIQSERDKAAAQESLLKEREGHIRSLDRLVFERTRDIQSILATINQGIMMIGLKDNQLQIGSEYSRYLSNIVATRDIAGQDPFTLIFARSNLASDIVDQTRQVIFSCIGDLELSYELNSDLLIREVILPCDDGAYLYIEIDWLPVLDPDQKIDKMLVILRDVTQLRVLRDQARAQENELIITGELTGRQGRKFPLFYQRTRQEIEDICRQSSTRSHQEIVSEGETHTLLRFLPTLKGDARIYELQTLAQCIHEAESSLLSLKAINWLDVQRVLTMILQLLEHYDQIRRVRLGFEPIEERQAIPAELVTGLFHLLDEVMQMETPLRIPSKTLYQQWNEVLGCGLESVLIDPIQNLKKLAWDLKKSVPLIVFQGDVCAIPQPYHSRISQALAISWPTRWIMALKMRWNADEKASGSMEPSPS